MSGAATELANPFKGLASFQDTELDAKLFCGREREREVVVANLLASRLTVLYGASGVGKTSLLRAGVAHALRQAGEAVVVLHSTWAGDPRRDFGETIDAAAGIESSGTIAERLHAASLAVGGDVYVILDQFEEYFLYRERDPFAGELAEAIREPGLRANVLLGLREDALAKLDAFKNAIPNLFANYLRLDHLDRRGARAAMLGPIERYNELSGEQVRAEPELVEAVLDQVAAGKVDVGRAGRGGVEADEERIEAPYLQLVLERIWEVERDRGSSVLRLETLRELGGAEAIVRGHLERALGSLEPAEQDVAATMFDHLVTPSGSKIAHRAGDLAQYASVREADLLPVLGVLGRERIVRAVDGAGGGERYEIFHDVLADGVLAWRARRVLERDRETARTRQRRLAVLAALALLALAGMTAVAVYALVERSHARSATARARARALEATALNDLTANPQSALADALVAARMAPGPRAQDVLRQALVGSRLRRVLPAGGRLSAVGYSNRGARMLAAGADGHVRIYSDRGRLERTLTANVPIVAASFSPDGSTVLAAGGREVELWNVASGRLLHLLRLPRVVTSATFSGDGRLLLTTGVGGSTVWRTATGARVAVLDQHPVLAGAFSPDGRLAATLSGSKPRRVRIFDTRHGRLRHVLTAPGELEGVSFSPTGRLLATASYRGTYLWNPSTGRQVGRPLHDTAGVEDDAEFNPDGTLLAVGSQDGVVRVWDVASGERRFFLAAHTNPVLRVAWSPDGRFIADASRDRSVFVWGVEGSQRGQRVGSLVGHRDDVVALAWSPHGTSLLSGSADRTARLWDVRFEQHLLPLGAHHGAAVTASFDRSGRRVVSAGDDGTARIWDARRRRLVRTLPVGGRVNDARFSPDGRLVATAGSNGAAIWDAASGSRLRTLRTHAPVLAVRFSPDGVTVATGDAAGGIRLWRTRDGRLLVSKSQQGGVMDEAFAPDGRALATAGRDGVSVWKVPTGRRLRILGSAGGVSRVAFSRGGELIAAAGLDGVARIWDVASGELNHALEASRPPVTGVAFSPDGRLLLTTGSSVRTWDARSGAPRHTFVGHVGPVSGGAFSPDGRWIVTAGPATAGLWLRNVERAYFFLRSTNPAAQHKLLTSASFSAHGQRVLTSSEDGSVRVYTCEICGDLPALERLASERLASLRRGFIPKK